MGNKQTHTIMNQNGKFERKKKTSIIRDCKIHEELFKSNLVIPPVELREIVLIS